MIINRDPSQIRSREDFGHNRQGAPIMVAFKSILVAAAIAIALAFQPGPASAQTIGMGGDGYTRGMWHATDGSINIWKIDPSLNFVGQHAYGPYGGWSPVALTTLPNNNTYVLWRYTDGTARLWVLDANLNFITSGQYGPIAGWTPAGLAVDNFGNIPLLWATPQGQLAVWLFNPALNLIGSNTFGPYFGWSLLPTGSVN